jgi:hypothetical protein
MYPLSSQKMVFSQEALEFVMSSDFGSASNGESEHERLRSIADMAFDLSSKIQKTGKLRKLGQLGKNGEAEYDSNIRLVGLMIHILRSYHYNDAEMMSSLEKKYQTSMAGIAG